MQDIKRIEQEEAEAFSKALGQQGDLTLSEREFLAQFFERRNNRIETTQLKVKYKVEYHSIIEKGYVRVLRDEETGWFLPTHIESFPKYILHNAFELAKERTYKEKLEAMKKEKKKYSKQEMEEMLDPMVCKLRKQDCMNGQDIVQVILPWLDEENKQVEIYIVRKENGEIIFSRN